MKGQAASIRAKRQIAYAHRNGGKLLKITADRSHRVNVSGWKFVIGLIDSPGEEIDPRAIVRPARLALIEFAGGELPGLGEFVGSCGYVEQPDVLMTFGIEVSLIVVPVDSAVNDVHVGFVFGFQLCLFWLGGILRRVRFACFRVGLVARFGAILLTSLLLEIFGSRRTEKSNAPAVRRPDRIGSAFGQVRDSPGFTPTE